MAAVPSVFDGLQCNGCGAQLHVAAGLRTADCPYCKSPNIVTRSREVADDPTFVLGFAVTQQVAVERARAWIRGGWFTPTRFAKADVTQTRGVYVPAYLYTAVAHVSYSVSIGEHYTVTETYTTVDSKGKAVTRTRTKTVTEWRPLNGRWEAYLDDIFVTASRGLDNAELEAVEPFDTRALRRYSHELLSGWIAEDPSIAVTQCNVIARDEAVVQIGRRLEQHMPGDSHRELDYNSTFSNEDLEAVLVPVWILVVAYDDNLPPVRVIINGQSGKIAGTRPRSWLKIVATIVAALAAITLVVLLGSLI